MQPTTCELVSDGDALPVGQNSNGIDSTVARLSLGMKWMYRRVLAG